MSATEVHDPGRDAKIGNVDLRLEIDVLPVSDVDEAKHGPGLTTAVPVRPQPDWSSPTSRSLMPSSPAAASKA